MLPFISNANMTASWKTGFEVASTKFWISAVNVPPSESVMMMSGAAKFRKPLLSVSKLLSMSSKACCARVGDPKFGTMLASCNKVFFGSKLLNASLKPN